ncbi:thioesterase [Planomonospora sp. ID67723]|uniref:thioesterase II family protein n=1 Tax=Planomonospora sp. ID67723 TaxID=2738134 RepID=UPI0018C3BBD2|nr:alpha/beta fold hydrolase [Planomonospora sp. ID67723]MBG0829104.1 thioesterase [Planomonospora sp. ID67723]
MRTPPWYLAFEPRPSARIHLYALPCAGSGPSAFRPWTRHLPPWVELRALTLPGRPGRHREPAHTDCDTAARALAAEVAGESTPYAVFGHSMGAMLGYRMVRELESAGARLPELLAVAAWPVRGAVTGPDPRAGDERFIEALRELGGLPDEIARDPDALALTLPVARADFTLCASYTYRAEPPLPVPVAAFCGTRDQAAPARDMAEWRQHTTDFRGLRIFDGGHFFVRDRVGELVTAMTAILEMRGSGAADQPERVVQLSRSTL